MTGATVATGPAVEVGPDSRLLFHDLVVRREDDQVIVGRLETCEFVALPELGGEAIALLRAGRSVSEVEAQLSALSGALVDLRDFAANLVDLGFVQSVDGHATVEAEVFESSLRWLRPPHCRWLFGGGAKLVYAIVAVAALTVMAVHPDLVPTTRDFFWSAHPSLVLAVNTAMMLTMIAIHELAHLVAARSLGVPGRFSLGTRLNVLVAQTNVTGLWAVERQQRYRAYFAGMALDTLVFCIIVIVQGCLRTPSAILSALALLQVLGVISQFQLYMRTDLYFVLANLLRAKNLMEDAAVYVLWLLQGAVAWVARRPRSADVLATLPVRERWAARVYSVFMLGGSVIALSVYAVVGLPILFGLYARALHGVLGGNPATVVDGLVTLTVEGSLQITFLWVLVRNRGARVRAILRRVTAGLKRSSGATARMREI